ncbi:MAG TPA: fasciclin domain-containing protein [Steroidobacteraceae bacterium]|nr:fasciclin domain-containing protein [Steroidobacteraceae bacterium]
MDASPAAPARRAPPAKNIVETASSADSFTTLVTGLRATGLADTIGGRGPYTMFAPTDEAFRKLPAAALSALMRDTARLRAVLSYHVVHGYLMARDLKSGSIKTLQGSPLSAVVTSADVRINGARVTHADFIATNGVLHALDTLILPKGWQLLSTAA